MEKITLKSYFELSKAMQYLRKVVSDSNLNVSEAIIALVGCTMVGIRCDDLAGYKWRTNHYLIEALGVSELPPPRYYPSSYLTELKNLASCLQGIVDQTITKHSRLQCIAIKENFESTIEHVCQLLITLARQKGITADGKEYFTEKQKEEFNRNGYLIIPSVLDKNDVGNLAALTLYIAEREESAGVAYKYGGKNNKLQRIYNLISKHPVYIECLEMPLVKEILEFYFERDTLHHKYVLSSFQANILHPLSESQQLHTDVGSLGHPLPSYPTRLNINFLLTDWTYDNGATLLLPGSHTLLRSPKPEEVVDTELTKVLAPEGSVVIWSGHIWHKSGRNDSNRSRFGLFACFATSQLKECSTEEEHLLVVDQEVRDTLSPEMKFMIGLGRGVKMGATHRVDYQGTEFEKMTLWNNVTG